jgi:hypothetical protein
MKNTSERNLVTQLSRTRLTQAQEGLLRAVTLKAHLPIDDVADRTRDVQTLVSGGYVRLAAIVYPWGLDFELEPASDGSMP